MLDRVRVLIVSFGFVAVSVGTGLAAYGSFFASRPAHVVTNDESRGTYGLSLADVPEAVGTFALATGVLSSLGALAVWVSRQSSFGDECRFSARMMWACGGFTLAAFVISEELYDAYSELRETLTYFDQLPTVFGAMILVFVGSVLLLVFTPAKPIAPVGRTFVAIVSGMAVIGSLAFSAVAIRAGDDRVNIDRTTAAVTSIAPVPGAVTRSVYTIEGGAVIRGELGRVVAAAAGFVMETPDGIRAYDGRTGAERWHFERKPDRGPDVEYSVGSLAAYDEGAVVVATWDVPIGFDAMTGEVLWRGGDIAPLEWSGSDVRAEPQSSSADRDVMIRIEAGRLYAFDPRTGDQEWQYRSDCRIWETVTTASAVYVVDNCGSGGADRRFTLTAVEPSVGDPRATRDLVNMHADSLENLGDGVEVSRSGTAVVLSWSLRNPDTAERVRSTLVVREPGDVVSGEITADSPKGSALVTEQADRLIESSPVWCFDPQVVEVPGALLRVCGVDPYGRDFPGKDELIEAFQ